MFRRFLRAIKNYIRGPPQSQAGEDTKAQETHSHGIYTGTFSSSEVFDPPPSYENLKPHRSPLAKAPFPLLAPTSLDPPKTRPAAFDNARPPSPYVKAPPSAHNASANIRATPARDIRPDMDAEISHMVNNMVENALKLTQNALANLPTNMENGNSNIYKASYNLNSRYASGSSFYNRHDTGSSASTDSSQESSSADSTFDIGLGGSGSGASGWNDGIFYQTSGPGYNRNVFTASGNAYMANLGNTISITGESQSAGSSYSHYSGTNFWNAGSPYAHMYTHSLNVDLEGDTIVINGRKYPMKQGLGPLGNVTEITTKRVVVDGHIYYPEPKST